MGSWCSTYFCTLALSQSSFQSDYKHVYSLLPAQSLVYSCRLQLHPLPFRSIKQNPFQAHPVAHSWFLIEEEHLHNYKCSQDTHLSATPAEWMWPGIGENTSCTVTSSLLCYTVIHHIGGGRLGGGWGGGGNHITTSAQQLEGLGARSPEELHALRSLLRPFWTKIHYYSDEIILAGLVHTMLDSLGHRLGLAISVSSRAPASFVLAHLANIVTVWIKTKDENTHLPWVCLQTGVDL